MTTRSKTILGVYTALNLTVILSGVALTYGFGRAIVALATPLVIVPAGFIAICLLNRGDNDTRPLPWRAYRLTSTAFLGLSMLPALAWLLLLLALSETWPFNPDHGPDSPYAARVFEHAFRFPPPPSVSDLYGHSTWEFGDGNFYRIAFRYTDDAVTERIINLHRIQPLPPTDPAAQWDHDPADPAWWPTHGSVTYQKFYANPRATVRLWIDQDRRAAYFLTQLF